jgi:hypothetical protein
MKGINIWKYIEIIVSDCFFVFLEYSKKINYNNVWNLKKKKKYWLLK